MTFGLPSVSESAPRNARQPVATRTEAASGSTDDGRRPREAPGDIGEIRRTRKFQRDEQRRELVRDDRESSRRDRQPNQIAYCEARDERPDALQTMAENARDERGDARTGGRHRDEIYAGENS